MGIQDRDRLYIGFFCPGMPFDGETAVTKSLGGSETACWGIARELAKVGHRVKVFTNLPGKSQGGVWDEVQYLPAGMWLQYAATVPHDVCVVQRQPESFSVRTVAKANILWCHDLALGRSANGFRSALWNVDRVVVVSDFMKKQYQDIYDLPASLLDVCRNGIVLADVPPALEPRDMYRLVFAARPERGLDILLEGILPILFEKDPRFKLSIFGYNNPVQQLQPYYAKLSEIASKFGDRVLFEGHKSKTDLYAEYVKCGVYCYPTPGNYMPDFSEVSCISAMEAQACGLPFVTSNRGGLPESVGPGAGVLIDGDPNSKEYIDRFVDATMNYVTNETAAEDARKAGLAHVQNLQWSDSAAAWQTMLDNLSRTNNDSPTRLARHFYRRTDIFAAKKVIEREVEKAGGNQVALLPNDLLRLEVALNHEYSWLRNSETFAKHYIRGGKVTDKRLASAPIDPNVFKQTDEKRFHEIEAILGRHPQCERILDYGCGHGWSTIYYHNKLGRKWVGVDVDPGAIKWAETYAKDNANKPEDLTFVVGQEEKLKDLGLFDAVIVSEVLEHCIDPIGVMEKIEKVVKPRGLILITVPYGPSEYGTPNWPTFRNHLWEFEVPDIYDIFDKKETLNISQAPIYPNEQVGEMVGFSLIAYEADHAPLGQIDWDRKLKRQRPRQTVAAGLMAGADCTTTLAWCLESIRWPMDRIIIADTGMTEEGKKIARHYGAELVDCPSPLEVGFSYPRNMLLDMCETDWYLWIDTDERLLGGEVLTKYLRQSIWSGVSIRQHHFAVDTPFTPDMPVRCFRTCDIDWEKDVDGTKQQMRTKLRFYGMLHEHPELEINEGPGLIIVVPDTNLAHIGYLSESVRKRKFLRNNPLLQADIKANPERVLQKYFIMRDNCLWTMYESQQNGGVITPLMLDRARENISLYRKFFHANSRYVNIDPLPYYTEALKLLGEGIDISYNIAANRAGVGDVLNGGTQARFGSVDEAVEEIAYRVRMKMEPLGKSIW